MNIQQLITLDAIAGHEQAIDNYTKAIGDLMPQHGKDPLIDRIINQFVAIVRTLTQELKALKEMAKNGDDS